jgi:hypothetical protein
VCNVFEAIPCVPVQQCRRSWSSTSTFRSCAVGHRYIVITRPAFLFRCCRWAPFIRFVNVRVFVVVIYAFSFEGGLSKQSPNSHPTSVFFLFQSMGSLFLNPVSTEGFSMARVVFVFLALFFRRDRDFFPGGERG